jgi:hypothetical protein
LRCALRIAALSDFDCTPNILIASLELIGDSNPGTGCVIERWRREGGVLMTLHAFNERTANAGEAFEKSSASESCSSKGEGSSSSSGLQKSV